VPRLGVCRNIYLADASSPAVFLCVLGASSLGKRRTQRRRRRHLFDDALSSSPVTSPLCAAHRVHFKTCPSTGWCCFARLALPPLTMAPLLLVLLAFYRFSRRAAARWCSDWDDRHQPITPLLANASDGATTNQGSRRLPRYMNTGGVRFGPSTSLYLTLRATPNSASTNQIRLNHSFHSFAPGGIALATFLRPKN
jgi:hypothetical protein